MSEPDKFPVLVEVVERHVVWVEADDQAEAVAGLKADPEWYEAIDHETRVDADVSISAVEGYDWQSYVYPWNRRMGPLAACGECGKVSHDVRARPWHADHCSQHPDAPVKAVAS